MVLGTASGEALAGASAPGQVPMLSVGGLGLDVVTLDVVTRCSLSFKV